MAALIEAPREMIEAMADLRIPAGANCRLQELMDRNTDGALTRAEKKELKEIVEWHETISLIRAQAMRLLGRRPTR